MLFPFCQFELRFQSLFGLFIFYDFVFTASPGSRLNSKKRPPDAFMKNKTTLFMVISLARRPQTFLSFPTFPPGILSLAAFELRRIVSITQREFRSPSIAGSAWLSRSQVG
jgi:hypothetical protein